MDKALIFLCRFEVLHVLSNHYLHLQWIKVLLIRHHISEPSLNIFKLFELNEEHVVPCLEVLSDVVVGDSAIQLVEDCVDAAIEFSAVRGDGLIIVFVGLVVFVHPVLAVADHLIHSRFVRVVSLAVLREVCLHVGYHLEHLSFCAQEDVLNFLHVFFVLGKFVFQHVNCIDLCFQVHFR